MESSRKGSHSRLQLQPQTTAAWNACGAVKSARVWSLGGWESQDSTAAENQQRPAAVSLLLQALSSLFIAFFYFFSFPCFLCFYFPPSLVCSGTGKCGRRRVFFDVERDECVISVVGEGKSPNRRLAEGKCDRDRGGEESRSERRRGVVPCSRRRRMQKSRTGV